MSMKPIYKPRGRANEYCELALNIYDTCNHSCSYCWSRMMYERYHGKGSFGKTPEPRDGLLEALRSQLDTGAYKDKLIHLCFTCDPYPADVDTTVTRDVIKAIKESGARVQILTKGGRRAERDFDLLDDKDWFGVTYTGYPDGSLFSKVWYEPKAAPTSERLHSLCEANERNINTWISMEPVLIPESVLGFLDLHVDYVGKYKIGKLNHMPSSTDWADFGKRAERICRNWNHDYYIKDDLRREMSKEEADGR